MIRVACLSTFFCFISRTGLYPKLNAFAFEVLEIDDCACVHLLSRVKTFVLNREKFTRTFTYCFITSAVSIQKTLLFCNAL